MFRTVALVAAALALRAGPATAQPDPTPKDGKLVLSLTLTPAAPPKPVSRLYLLPEYRDLQPGDKLSGFLKCFMEQDVFFNRENSEKRSKWLAMPLADLPADVREQAGIKAGIAYDPPHSTMMVFVDRAARYTRAEWNEWFDIRKDGVHYLLPEVQRLRELARVLHLRLRGEVKNREFDRAVATVGTMLGLAKLLETHPTLIGSLVGMAVAAQALTGVEEMIQQPGCPNLFWSLTDLPAPLIALRNGLAGERVFLTSEFGDLRTGTRPLSDAELDAQLKRIDALVATAGGTGGGENPLVRLARTPRLRYAAWASDADRVAAARKRLVEYGGLPAAAVKEFPPLQVVVVDDLIQYEIARDELFKWINVPYPMAAPGLAAAEPTPATPGVVLAPILLPAVSRVKASEARTDQRVAYLRVIEAVRLHADANGGTLPESLAAVRLPLPADPVSGKPFEYKVADGVATLTGANPQPGTAATNRVYELRLRK